MFFILVANTILLGYHIAVIKKIKYTHSGFFTYMALITANKYGRITISDEAVAMVASRAASECYGVIELVSRRISDSVLALFNKVSAGKGIRVITADNRIFIDAYIVLKHGVNKEAVSESVASTIKYHVEEFTGMRVKSVDVHIVGVKI